MLAKRGILWESEEHLHFADEIFERINYFAIKASARLAEEKGAYPYFSGSDWQTGAYFAKRGTRPGPGNSWRKKLPFAGFGMGICWALAPTSSDASILAGTTAGVDPVMKKFFMEEKKGSILPRVAPELSVDTYYYYQSAHQTDRRFSVRACAVRQGI